MCVKKLLVMFGFVFVVSAFAEVSAIRLRTGSAAVERMRIWYEPHYGGPIIGFFDKGETFLLLEKSTDTDFDVAHEKVVWYRVVSAGGKQKGWVSEKHLRVHRQRDFSDLPKELAYEFLVDTYWQMSPDKHIQDWVVPSKSLRPKKLPTTVEWVYEGDINKDGEKDIVCSLKTGFSTNVLENNELYEDKSCVVSVIQIVADKARFLIPGKWGKDIRSISLEGVRNIKGSLSEEIVLSQEIFGDQINDSLWWVFEDGVSEPVGKVRVSARAVRDIGVKGETILETPSWKNIDQDKDLELVIHKQIFHEETDTAAGYTLEVKEVYDWKDTGLVLDKAFLTSGKAQVVVQKAIARRAPEISSEPMAVLKWNQEVPIVGFGGVSEDKRVDWWRVELSKAEWGWVASADLSIAHTDELVDAYKDMFDKLGVSGR